jgi:hypothetical protein
MNRRAARHWLSRLTVTLALAVASPLPASAQPASQEAFRAVLVKYDRLADVEADLDRLRALEANRAAELAEALGKGLRFEGWQLVLSASEATPMGGTFLRLLDPQLLSTKSVRPTYWNSGPGAVLREAEITPMSPLQASVALLKREAAVVVSGRFFADERGGPMFEAAHGSYQALTIERAKFRMPYFSIAVEAIEELFPERRFP